MTGVSAGNNCTVHQATEWFPRLIRAESEMTNAEIECLFVNSNKHFCPAFVPLHASDPNHNGKVATMSQFEDPSGQASVDPYSDAYTQPVALSRDQELNPRRSRSHSRERPASFNRASTPPKRPAHAPIVSCRDSTIPGSLIELFYRPPIHATCWGYSV